MTFKANGKPRRPGVPAVMALLALVACGSDDDVETDDTPAAAQQVEPDPEDHAPIEMDDIRPPEFGGVGMVELAGLDLFRVSWEPATDDISAPGDIRYKIYHVVEPYEELAADTPAIFTSEPGTTSATLAHDAPPGRFYVRALDAAGNLSAVTAGVLQRPERPLLRASDSTLAARIDNCHQTEPGRALCVGDEGFAAWWTDDGWEMLDLGVIARFRIAATQSGLFVYTDIGHLFRFGETSEPELIDLSFPRRDPVLPFRQFTADGLGLRYWIDAEGRVFVGADREFLPMTRPLALPGEDCRRLRGLAFAPQGSFAACLEGVVYSANPSNPGASWLSLTPNAEFDLETGFQGVIASNDTEGILFDALGVRRVGVGGWRPLLLTDWVQPGVHPMDVPEDPPDIGRVGQVFANEDTLFAVTDLGLFEYEDADWSLVSDTSGPLAGAVSNTDLGTSDDYVLVYEDGAVGQLRRRRREWIIRRDMRGFTRGFTVHDNTPIAFVDGADEGVYAWRDAEWQPVTDAPPARLTIVGAAGSPAERLYFYGADGVEGAIWVPFRGEWRRERWLYAPAPEPVEESAIVDEMVFDEDVVAAPPPAIVSVGASAAAQPPPTPEPILHLDVAPDGRAVAVSEHQIWWRVGDGWRLIAVRDGTLTAAFVDSGETFVVIENGAPVRCWRDTCEAPVQQTVGGPVHANRVVMGDGGWRVVEANGSVHRFVRSTMPPGEAPIDPAEVSPPGTWQTLAPLGGLSASLATFASWETGAALLTNDGEVYERDDGDWVLQAQGADILTLLAVDDAWAILTPRGLFRLGDVRPAVREQAPNP